MILNEGGRTRKIDRIIINKKKKLKELAKIFGYKKCKTILMTVLCEQKLLCCK